MVYNWKDCIRYIIIDFVDYKLYKQLLLCVITFFLFCFIHSKNFREEKLRIKMNARKEIPVKKSSRIFFTKNSFLFYAHFLNYLQHE